MDWKVSKVLFHRRYEGQPDYILANVSIVLNDELSLNEMRFAKKRDDDGFTVMFPKWGAMRRFYYFPFNNDLKLCIEKAVIERYEQLKAEGKWREDTPTSEVQ